MATHLKPMYGKSCEERLRLVTDFWGYFAHDPDIGAVDREELDRIQTQVSDIYAKGKPLSELHLLESLTARAARLVVERH